MWQSFNDADSCSCCGTTLETPLTPTSSETQRGREKHNCRCCGLVVCQVRGGRQLFSPLGMSCGASA